MVTTFCSCEFGLRNHRIISSKQMLYANPCWKVRTYMCPVVSLHNQLVSPSYKFKIVGVIKLFRYVLKMKANSWGQNWRKSMAIIRRYGISSTWPKVYPAPRGDMPQPHRSSGSDHRRSHIGPSWGTSWTRSKLRTLSRFSMDGDKPPWRQKISDSTFKQRRNATSKWFLNEKNKRPLN